jgi:hypothetical protein
MESVDLDHDGIEETSDKQLFSPSSPDRTDIFGDPQVNTRVGDDYQAEIPSMMTEFKRLQLLMNPADSGVVVDVSLSFLMGLPIPITWVQEVDDIENETQGFHNNHDEAVNSNGPVELRNRAKLLIKLKRKGSTINLEPLAVGLDHEKESRTENVGNIVAGKTNLAGLHKSKRYCPVPGSKCDPWSDAEVKSFILGLYIFGKNFVSIKKFLENKELGEILSFYYGEFYRSDDYRRWSDSRKVRSRKCITGRKIFTGWRLQELISRLHPNVPEEFQITLLEVLQVLFYVCDRSFVSIIRIILSMTFNVKMFINLLLKRNSEFFFSFHFAMSLKGIILCEIYAKITSFVSIFSAKYASYHLVVLYGFS